jgi:hypothetical protein
VESIPAMRSSVSAHAATASASSNASRASCGRSTRGVGRARLRPAASTDQAAQEKGLEKADFPSCAKSIPNALNCDVVDLAIVSVSLAG